MKQFNTFSLVVTFVILASLSASVVVFYNQHQKDKLIRLSDQVVSSFKAGLSYEMSDLLSFSMALAEDGELKNALILDDAHRGFEILSRITERFKRYTHIKSLRIQLLTPDFFIFARSWSEGFEGMPIWWFRDDLTRLKKNKQPKVGMELGRMLTFKATIPVRSGKKLLGYLEVIKFVDELVSKMSKKGIDVFVLMDEVYLKQAVLMRNYPLLHNYVIVNRKHNRYLQSQIQKLDWKKLTQNEFIYEQSRLYILEPMYNGEGKQIGVYLLTLAKEVLKDYEESKHHISFFTQFSDEDIKEVVKLWEYPYGSFRNGYDRDLIDLLPRLEKADKVEMLQEAREILEQYEKDELIDIILSNDHNEKKVGVIQ